MKHLRYLPLAFLAGAHGFALLAPYLALCMTAYAFHMQRKRRAASLPIQPRSAEEREDQREEFVVV